MTVFVLGNNKGHVLTAAKFLFQIKLQFQFAHFF